MPDKSGPTPMTTTDAPSAGPQSGVTMITKALDKVDGSDIMTSAAMEVEDEFADMYFTVQNGRGNVIQPPYDMKAMKTLVVENNTLSQCITAYEVNIDGTGYEIDLRAEEEPSEAQEGEISQIKDFFDEIWLRESFTTHRRRIRRDLEGTGNGYLEVIRNVKGTIVFARWLDCINMRVVRLGDPVPVKRKITRLGKELEVTVSIRERAFIQRIGTKTVYFKEFGASRDIHKATGQWSDRGVTLPATDRSTEIIHFTVNKDVRTPYGVPRWINQTPSVLGSRKAEELNLDFFEYGGIPPLLMMIQGGMMAEDSKTELIRMMNRGPKANLRAAVLEIHSTSGSLEKSAPAKVDVESFGSEQKNDSMFENYDDKCERRVRSSFRLPPMFLGKAEDYNFATAFASYTVAETQVFTPERDEFDEIINNTLMRDLGAEEYIYRSKALMISDSAVQTKALELAKDSISGESFVKLLAEITSLDMTFDQDTADEKKGLETADREFDQEMKRAAQNQVPIPPNAATGGASPPQVPPNGKPPLALAKADSMELVDLANDWAELVAGERINPELLTATRNRVESLNKHDRETVDRMMAIKMYSHPSRDWAGAADVCGCAMELLSDEPAA